MPLRLIIFLSKIKKWAGLASYLILFVSSEQKCEQGYNKHCIFYGYFCGNYNRTKNDTFNKRPLITRRACVFITIFWTGQRVINYTSTWINDFVDRNSLNIFLQASNVGGVFFDTPCMLNTYLLFQRKLVGQAWSRA